MLLYPEIVPYNTGELVVSGTHSLYYEQCGNPYGKPVIYLHGGPGGSCKEKHRQYFHPEKYRIILFDQRGCGKSTPWGELSENTTAHLVADLEKLRQHLGVSRWLVTGGSWGSTLALLYAQNYPQHVTALVLKGTFLADPHSLSWMVDPWGAGAFFPQEYEQFLAILQAHGLPHHNAAAIYGSYHQLMRHSSQQVRREAALAYLAWELRLSVIDGTFTPPPPPDEENLVVLQNLARINNHYAVNNCFIEPNQIMHNVHRLRSTPATLVHGRYDLVCPIGAVWQLHKQWPGSKLVVIDDAGHAGNAAEDDTDAFIKAIDNNIF